MNDAREQVSRIERSGNILTLVIDFPPVNALGLAVRRALTGAIATLNSDDEADALIIRCEGRTFFAGTDIRELDQPPTPPFLPDIVNCIERSAKPVIAAMHGTALGGGLEVAMGCHYRIAAIDTKFGLPEVKLGLMPGAGGTQRLPRLIGLEKALTMMTSGDPIATGPASELGLIDRVSHVSIIDDSLAFAQEIAAQKHIALPRTSERNKRLAETGGTALFDEFLKANARKFRDFKAPSAIVDVVRFSLAEPFDASMARERAAFLHLREGSQSKALRHVFFAERESSRVPGLAKNIPTLPIRQVAIIGAGTMGSGIALAFLAAGFKVTLIDNAQSGLDRGFSIINSTLDRNVKSGRMTAEGADDARVSLSSSLNFADVGTADLIVEAAFETMEVKQDIFRQLDQLARPDAIMATNTSYLDVDAIATMTSRPAQVVGLHFFSPANIMKLLEVVRSAHTSDNVLVTVLELARKLDKIPVVSRNAYGFIGNRMLAVRRAQSEAMVTQGTSPYDIDRVAEAFGMPMGPFRIGDLAGLDLGWSAEISTGSTIRERLCEIGRRGQKTNAGYYDYVDGKAQPSSAVLQLIAQFSTDQDIVIDPVDDDAAILARLLYPMINEGASILQDGVALRASDIDVVWLHGYGWPRWTGGPMHYADSIGLQNIISTLDTLGDSYEPCALMRRLAESGSSFAEHDTSQDR